MILCHRHRFIFIRCRKTASTSIEIELSRHVGEDDIVTSLSPRDEALRAAAGGRAPQHCGTESTEQYYNHMSAGEIFERVGREIWNSYFKFCFERNPWDKVISLYFHRYKSDPRPSLDDFIASGEALDARNARLYTIGGEVAVDFVGQYSSLERDFVAVTSRLGLHVSEPLLRAKSQFRLDRRPIVEFLTSPQIRQIHELFLDEIELWGYTPRDRVRELV